MKRYIDLGGIKNKDGKIIKKNMILRSSNLNKLNQKEINEFKVLNLAKIIDLRTSVEINEKPDTIIEDVKYIDIPIFSEKTLGVTHEKINVKHIENILNNIPNMTELYEKMVSEEESVLAIKNVIDEILNSNDYPILFHCTAGKDRTGIISMILLNILDVDMDVILKNYLSVNKRLEFKAKIAYHFINMKLKDKYLALKIQKTLMVDESYLYVAIKFLDKKYGSLELFIKDKLEITDKMKEDFKKKMLV